MPGAHLGGGCPLPAPKVGLGKGRVENMGSALMSPGEAVTIDHQKGALLAVCEGDAAVVVDIYRCSDLSILIEIMLHGIIVSHIGHDVPFALAAPLGDQWVGGSGGCVCGGAFESTFDDKEATWFLMSIATMIEPGFQPSDVFEAFDRETAIALQTALHALVVEGVAVRPGAEVSRWSVAGDGRDAESVCQLPSLDHFRAAILTAIEKVPEKGASPLIAWIRRRRAVCAIPLVGEQVGDPGVLGAGFQALTDDGRKVGR